MTIETWYVSGNENLAEGWYFAHVNANGIVSGPFGPFASEAEAREVSR